MKNQVRVVPEIDLQNARTFAPPQRTLVIVGNTCSNANHLPVADRCILPPNVPSPCRLSPSQTPPVLASSSRMTHVPRCPKVTTEKRLSFVIVVNMSIETHTGCTIWFTCGSCKKKHDHLGDALRLDHVTRGTRCIAIGKNKLGHRRTLLAMTLSSIVQGVKKHVVQLCWIHIHPLVLDVPQQCLDLGSQSS